MLIATKDVRDWKDLQNKVAQLFSEMGYHVETPKVVPLAGRGQKEVDVYVEDLRLSVPHRILIECKHWAVPVSQDTVHSMLTVTQGAGANTALIVSKVGFQSGAGEAATSTPINLCSFEELQHRFGNEWYLRQQERLAPIKQELLQIDRLFLDDGSGPTGVINLIRFGAVGTQGELLALLAKARRFVLSLFGMPRSYDVPGPIDLTVDKSFDGHVIDKDGLEVVRLADVREAFAWALSTGRSLIDAYTELQVRTHKAFDLLITEEQESAWSAGMSRLREDMPLRCLKDRLPDGEYKRLLNLALAQR